jgi:hypothetical protein
MSKGADCVEERAVCGWIASFWAGLRGIVSTCSDMYRVVVIQIIKLAISFGWAADRVVAGDSGDYRSDFEFASYKNCLYCVAR